MPEELKMEILTQHSLSDVGCSEPGCTHDHSELFLHAGCHDEGLWARYKKANGHLTLMCSVCETPLATFLVAAGGH